MTVVSDPTFFGDYMRLGELSEHEQNEVMKAMLIGEKPVWKDSPVDIPNNLSVRFTCANYDCNRLLTPSYYKSDLFNIPNRVRCPTCGHWATRYYIGATVDLVKEVKRKVQKRMTDYNQP